MSSLLVLAVLCALFALVGVLGDRLDHRAKARWERRFPPFPLLLVVLLVLGVTAPAMAQEPSTCRDGCSGRGTALSPLSVVGWRQPMVVSPCDPTTLATVLWDVIADMRLSTDFPPPPLQTLLAIPLAPAQRLRAEASAIEAKDTRLIRARQLVATCAPAKETP